MTRITLSVTNDIATDQRVNRISRSLLKAGYAVRVIGRKYRGSLPLPNLPYETRRMRLIFKKGPFFYLEYNVRLLFYLLFTGNEILVANDLDTLPANYLASVFKRRVLVYDCHEYFTEVPELVRRNHVKKIWELIESIILPHIRFSYTVSESIAKAYHSAYNIQMQVIRNLPYLQKNYTYNANDTVKFDGNVILYQGALNMGRGLELAVKAMQHLNEARMLIVGGGDIEHNLKKLAQEIGVQERVIFTGRIPYENIVQYTQQAHLGFSLEENLGLNYYYALPNKLFDYIQAGVPVLVSEFPEMAAIVNKYHIGKICNTKDPYELALIFKEMLTNTSMREVWKSNLEKAAAELCWENEEKKLMDIYAAAQSSVKLR